MSSFRKAHKAQRKEHKERSQLKKREKLGQLEKGKDWKLRRDDYHFKGKRLKALYEKARNKNPDEYYHAMVKTKTKNGVHTDTRVGVQYSHDEFKLMQTQDLGYLNLRMVQETSKIEKLKGQLHVMNNNDDEDEDTFDDEDDFIEGGGGSAGLKTHREHIVFVDSKKAVKKFNAAKHFDTAPELVGRAHNRPRMETLRTQAVVQPGSEKILEKMERKRESGYKELEQRIDRLGALKKVAGAMQTQRNLQGKGMRRKVKSTKEGKPDVYKWRKERKK